jgi:hypothetical protein
MNDHPKDYIQQKTAGPRDAGAACPIISGKDYAASSVFRPEALLREGRRQKKLPLVAVPEVCIRCSPS